MKPTIMLTAGGTGGHLFPAQALACELKRRGYGVELITDSRADKYGAEFPADKIHLVKSDTIRSVTCKDCNQAGAWDAAGHKDGSCGQACCYCGLWWVSHLSTHVCSAFARRAVYLARS